MWSPDYLMHAGKLHRPWARKRFVEVGVVVEVGWREADTVSVSWDGSFESSAHPSKRLALQVGP
jgi:hypothetical protein